MRQGCRHLNLILNFKVGHRQGYSDFVRVTTEHGAMRIALQVQAGGESVSDFATGMSLVNLNK